MHQLDTADSNAIKCTNKMIKLNKTQGDTAINSVNIENSDEDTPFRYDGIPFNRKKESLFQIIKCSTLSNSEENIIMKKRSKKINRGLSKRNRRKQQSTMGNRRGTTNWKTR